MADTVSKLYAKRVAAGEIAPDSAQEGLALRLDGLSKSLAGQRPAKGLMLRRPKAADVRGLYIHGAVGRGKTMMMDLFAAVASVEPRRRMHFHEFMAEVHDRIKRGRATTEGDPIPFVAAELAGEAKLLCLDELQVTDIADAMVLGRLFKVLFERGTVVVATTNSAPRDLYANGLNRQLFLPFIAMIEERMEVVQLEAREDYRLAKLAGRQLYFTPADAASRAELDRHWQRLTGGHKPEPATLEVTGRRLDVPMASMGVARFAFADLCECALGARDYLALAHAFHTVLIDGIPRLTPERRNEARRLVNLIDALYDNRVSLIASAEAEPDDLYPAGDGSLMFERTASRLIEMRSEAYLARGKRV